MNKEKKLVPSPKEYKIFKNKNKTSISTELSGF